MILSENSIKKVFYVHPVSGTGGALQALLRLVTDLDKNRYYPKVVCPEVGPSYRTFKSYNIDVEVKKGIKAFNHFSAGWFSIFNIYKLIKNFFNIFYSAAVFYIVVKKENPDIVHLSSSVLLGPAIGAKAAKKPIVWHIREYLHDGYFGFRKWIITRLIDKLSNAIICITSTDASRLKPSKKISVIYDSVNFNFFERKICCKKFRREFNIREHDRVIGMFGGVSRIKGTIEFAKAAKAIVKREKGFKFFIFGQVPDSSQNEFYAKVKKNIKKFIFHQDYNDKVKKTIGNDLNEIIKIVGERKDIPNIMAGLDLIVFPSTVPHSALPVIEAGAMAKPVIASNWGETSEEVVDGITGVLIPPGNPEALTQEIVKMLSNPKLSKKMGEEGYKRARELFDIKKNTSKVVEIYDKILRQYSNENSSH